MFFILTYINRFYKQKKEFYYIFILYQIQAQMSIFCEARKIMICENAYVTKSGESRRIRRTKFGNCWLGGPEAGHVGNKLFAVGSNDSY